MKAVALRVLFCLSVGLFIGWPHSPAVALFSVVALLATLSGDL